jgi:hypothetical protein
LVRKSPVQGPGFISKRWSIWICRSFSIGFIINGCSIGLPGGCPISGCWPWVRQMLRAGVVMPDGMKVGFRAGELGARLD